MAARLALPLLRMPSATDSAGIERQVTYFSGQHALVYHFEPASRQRKVSTCSPI